MSGVFLSYRQNRRIDGNRTELRVHAQLVEAIAERLGRHFGEASVFLDTSSLRLAARYPDELEKRLRASDVVVAVIHREWLADLAERGERDKDWVHFELATALAEGITVLPVLIDGARPPLRRELPEDIGVLEILQAHRIQFGHWERDIRRLVNAVAEHVPTDPLPEESPEPPPAGRRWYGPVVTGIAAAFAPAVLVRFLVGDATAHMAWLAAVSGALLFVLMVLTLMMTVMNLLRRPLDALDLASAERPHDEKTNVIIGITIAAMGIAVLLGSDFLTPALRVLSLAVIVGVFITFGSQWLLNRREAGAWPKARLPVHPASVRDALAQVRRRLTEWEAPLSRTQHDVLAYALDQAERCTDRLDELCRADRRTWLPRSSPWLVNGHIALLAATVGAAMAAVLAHRTAGGGPWPAVAWAGGCVVLAVGFYLAAIDRAYRFQRWRRQVVVDAVPARLEELRARLKEMSITG